MACCAGCGHASSKRDLSAENRAYNEGKMARRQGMIASRNPYGVQTLLGCAWYKGWCIA